MDKLRIPATELGESGCLLSQEDFHLSYCYSILPIVAPNIVQFLLALFHLVDCLTNQGPQEQPFGQSG